MNSPQEFLQWLGADKPEAFVASSRALPAQVLKYPWLWMSTSGTTSAAGQDTRWIAHTQQSLLSSARTVCAWLEVTRNDVWGRVLPRTHMGGFSLDVRSFISGCQVIDGPAQWSAPQFTNWVEENRVTLVSFVPTQIFDLCQAQLKAPSSLRAVIVGADRLDAEILNQARELGWPIVMTYGLTETASMIAGQATHLPARDLPGLIALPHAQVRLNETHCLEICSSSLFCAELVLGGEEIRLRQREGDWWTTSDRARIEGDRIFIEGRVDDFVKIYGVLVHLPSLDIKLSLFLKRRGNSSEAVFVSFEDPRAGARLEIRIEGPFDRNLLEEWNEHCLGNERASAIRSVPVIPRTELGKLRRQLLRDPLQNGR